MKVVILAGGKGTRMGDETLVRPKPLIEIGSYPILWHIMNIYADAGFNEFVIALGYRGEMIRDFFLDDRLRTSDRRVHLVDTGEETMTGGRVKRLRDLIGDETFLLTYGDGLADIDVRDLVAFHRRHGRLATVTAVRPAARFGVLEVDEASGQVSSFNEKPQVQSGWINGGFFVLEPQVLNSIAGDETPFEVEPLSQLAAAGEVFAYQHPGFWQPMDTIRDRMLLERLWAAGSAPWLRRSALNESR